MEDEELIDVLALALEDCVVEMHELQKQILILRQSVFKEIKYQEENYSEPAAPWLTHALDRTHKYKEFPWWKYHVYSKHLLELK